MTLQEFKAWFDGFTEAMEKTPTQKQWARIKARVAEIDGVAVTERVYIDRWVQPYRPYYFTTFPYASPTTLTGLQGFGSCVSGNAIPQNAGYAPNAVYSASLGSDYTDNGVKGGGAALAFNGIAAMADAGRAEAASIN